MKSALQLEKEILRTDGKSYPAYRDLKGKWDFESYVLEIEHVQSDPYASPSTVVVEIEHPGYPEHLYENAPCRIALQDALLREFGAHLRLLGSRDIEAARVCQQVLERSACRIDPKSGSLRFELRVRFPAAGRRILARQLRTILCEQLPVLVKDTLIYASMDEREKEDLQNVYELTCDQQAVREYLAENGYCAFIADGSILPRASGASDLPMKDALAFESPAENRITIDLPYGDSISGLGIKEGITVIAGGGYHGKSTLLAALEQGVYNHIAGDGREFALSRGDAMKIRSEDGRPVHQEDISMFIRSLPEGRPVRSFVSEDASGSTSQAANVLEALEAGSRLLLIDEDTCAANFMVRDLLMSEVVGSDQEPIIPYCSRIKQLKEQGISTILVAGSSGAFFEPADFILQMKDFEPLDITEKAKEAASHFETGLPEPEADHFALERIPLPLKRGKDDRVKIKTNGTDTIVINREPIDIRYLEQLADSQQAAAIGQMIAYADRHLIDGKKTNAQIADELEAIALEKGVQAFGRGYLAMPRRYELLGAINRQRSREFRQK